MFQRLTIYAARVLLQDVADRAKALKEDIDAAQTLVDVGEIKEVTPEDIEAAKAIVDDSLIGTYIIKVEVEAVVDAPTLTVGDVSGKEGQPIWLDISASLTDTDGSEKLSLIIFDDVVDLGGLGFSHGESFDSSDYENAWYFEEPSYWGNLSIIPTSVGSFTLSAVALSTEYDNFDVVESSIVNMNVDVQESGGGVDITGWF